MNVYRRFPNSFLEVDLFVSISLREASHLDEFLRDCAKPENQITPVQFFTYVREPGHIIVIET